MKHSNGQTSVGAGLRRHAGVGQAQKVRGVVTAAQMEAARTKARNARRMWAAALLVFGGSMAAMFQSCSGAAGPKMATGDNAEPLVAKSKPRAAAGAKTTGERVKLDDDPNMEKSARALEDMLGKMHEEEGKAADRPESSEPDAKPVVAASAKREVVAPRKPAPVAAGANGAGGGAANVAASLDDAAATGSSATVEPPKGRDAKSIAVRRAELATELASLLRPVAADGSDSMSALAPMLALEAVQPGAASAEIETAVKLLTPEEAAAVRSVRELLRKLGSDPLLAADPRALSRELSNQLDQLATHAPSGGLALGTVALCSRVESFGRYSPLASSRMIAGKNNAAILYAEVGNFVQRPAFEVAGDGRVDQEGSLTVQLEEEVELWHDDGTLQWRASPATIRDHSRTRRNDFFLVQRIDLPPNLSVGKYNLKVTVRDVGAEGSPQTEATIPIEIIADPRLAVGGPRPQKGVDDDRDKPDPTKVIRPTEPKRNPPVPPVVKYPTPPTRPVRSARP